MLMRLQTDHGLAMIWDSFLFYKVSKLIAIMIIIMKLTMFHNFGTTANCKRWKKTTTSTPFSCNGTQLNFRLVSFIHSTLKQCTILDAVINLKTYDIC